MPEKILSVAHLSVTLGGNEILDGLSFNLEKSDVLAIIGPNGSGKTVLLKTLLGLIKPTEGKVLWARGVKLGYVPQKIDADRHLPVNLRNLLEAKAHIMKLAQKEIAAVSKTVGLSPEILETPVGHLSGGHFQKALIAFALLGDPNVILFDEPTASLDELSEEHVYELVHELQDNHGITVILVSHDLSVVSRYATRVFCLNKRSICFGTPKEALTPEVLDKLYMSPHKYFHHLSDHHHA